MVKLNTPHFPIPVRITEEAHAREGGRRNDDPPRRNAAFFTSERARPMHGESIKHVGDALSLSVVLATIANWLPSIAAIVSIVWGCIRIYETQTVQRWLGKE